MKRQIIDEDFYSITSIYERLRFILLYGILAPSTHNSQPWLFKIRDTLIEVYSNPKYCLPYADPLKRDMYISIGCCLENIIKAGRYFRIFEKLEIVLKEELVAILSFKDVLENKDPDLDFKEYLEAIKTRQNVRGLFENKNIEESIIDEIKSLNDFEDIEVLFLKDKTKIEEMAKLTAEGIRRAYTDKNFRKEMSKWIYPDLIKTRKDGIPTSSLKAPFPFSILLPYLIRYLNIGKKLSELNKLSIASAPLSIGIFSKNNNPESWIKVGMLSERIMLYLKTKEIKTSIFVAAIEMGLTNEVKNLFGTELEPQFHFCAGYMKSNDKYTPRRSIDEFIMH